MTNVGFAKAIEHIFLHSQENADVEWKFTRTQMWLEWIDRINNVPVPFNLLYFILRCLFSECFKKCCCEGVSGQMRKFIIIIRSTISTIIFLISIRDKMARSREQDTHFSTIP